MTALGLTALELLGFVAPDWHRDALCREYPEIDFFAASSHEAGQAKAVCASCAVRLECLAVAVTDPSIEGVWGGTTGSDRKRLRGPGKRGRPRIPYRTVSDPCSVLCGPAVPRRPRVGPTRSG